MHEFLSMSLLDLCWGVPFLYLSHITMFQLIDSFCQIYIGKERRSWGRLLDCTRAGDKVYAGKILDSARDPLLIQLKSPLIRFLNGASISSEEIKDWLKKANSSLNLKLPHEEPLNSFCGDILYVGFFGTIISMFFLFSRFDMNVSEFSEIFVYMGMAMKSSAFGIAASFLVSRGLVILGQRLEVRENIVKGFCVDFMKVFSTGKCREESKGPDQSREKPLVMQQGVVEAKVEMFKEASDEKTKG